MMGVTAPSKPSREDFISVFSQTHTSPDHLKKATDAALSGCVKKHVFNPSGRVLFTVVGRSGDEFIDPQKPFCSCRHFFFRVLGGRDQTCYHLLAYEMAKETQNFDDVEMHDEEFGTFLRLLASDLIAIKRDKKEDKDNQKPSDSSRPR
jgi:predicted nucleic acid-binding Zn finger protein